MAKQNAKTKKEQPEMAEETTAPEATAEAGEQQVPESVNLSDLGTLLQIVDLATQRGAFRGAELSQVGAVFDKLNAFLSYVQEQQAAQEEAGEEAASEE
jgi:hypothetical protein